MPWYLISKGYIYGIQPLVVFYSPYITCPILNSYGKDKNSKWEMEIELLEHPTQEVLGKMVWQTTASVIRLEIINLIDLNDKKGLTALLDDLKSCEWYIACDANGQIALEEV